MTTPTALSILLALAACGLRSDASSPTEDSRPPVDEPEDQHFCCTDVDPKAMTGDGCTAISGALETINACANLLYCDGNYTKTNGKVACE
jgi:predicted small lipoprotein YifL